ncbi:guanylate kinase [Spiribacter sp. 2438]|uniref:guanylate kinase n=1 Tax=Spiribacter sp. 2438 TaxID=2666185 RepID=UPI001E282994|nr:guanylate kinase [Spiribacter sp. 2438]
MRKKADEGSIIAMEQGMGGTLYIVSAPSGAGKTSLLRALMERDPQMVFSVSHTTRAPRPGEADGRDYHFVDDEAFLALIEAGAFLEHARVFDRRYGTTHAAVAADVAAGRDVLLEIDWQGARQIRAQWPNTVSVFVLPPSLEALEERLRGRNQDSDAVIARRMAAAVSEMAHAAEYDYLVWNNDFVTALSDFEAIVRARRLTVGRQMLTHGPALEALTAAEPRSR